MIEPDRLLEEFGRIDIYLFDQLMKGRIESGAGVLDAGCGTGRNVVYLLRMGCQVFGLDQSEEAINAIRETAESIRPGYDPSRFQVGQVEAMPFPDQQFDVVICNAVLHFARSSEHFDQMVDDMWRVLKPGGLLFARLGSSIGIEDAVIGVGDGRFQLPSGVVWFLADEQLLLGTTARLGAKLPEPIKTTNVQGARCMTTWVASKDG